MMAYLSMMAVRLLELRRVLKPTGSIYLHCDPTASHYLKILMDATFGPEHFLNEIIWKRTHSHGNVARNYGAINDNILFYAKGQDHVWHQRYTPFPPEHVEEKFTGKDPDGRRYQNVTLRNPGVRPNLRYPYTASNGITYHPHPNGWSCEIERMRKYDREGRLHFPAKEGGQLRLRMYLDEQPGIRLQNIWADIPALNSQAQERLGYPTQKPQALLERILTASSNEGRFSVGSVLRLRHDHPCRSEAQAPMDRNRHHAPCNLPHRKAPEGRLPWHQIRGSRHTERPGRRAGSGRTRQVSIPMVGRFAGERRPIRGQEERRGFRNRRADLLQAGREDHREGHRLGEGRGERQRGHGARLWPMSWTAKTPRSACSSRWPIPPGRCGQRP